MFDIGASELLLTVIVAIVVIGPKDLPRALRMAGSWLAKIRRVSGHFRSGIEEMIRQAELDEMEKKWREKNAEIMKETPGHVDPTAPEATYTDPALPAPVPEAQEPYLPDYPTTPIEAAPAAETVSPELPLAPPKAQP
jgi:sec-independent protein translocase protein TatB